MLLQLKQRGAPIDWRTIMEACNVPNVGATPDGNTVQERYWNEQEQTVIHALRVKKIAAELGLEDGGMPGQPTGGGSTKGKGGRPPSGQSAPQLKQKGDGRSLVSESS